MLGRDTGSMKQKRKSKIIIKIIVTKRNADHRRCVLCRRVRRQSKLVSQGDPYAHWINSLFVEKWIKYCYIDLFCSIFCFSVRNKKTKRKEKIWVVTSSIQHSRIQPCLVWPKSAFVCVCVCVPLEWARGGGIESIRFFKLNEMEGERGRGALNRPDLQ